VSSVVIVVVGGAASCMPGLYGHRQWWLYANNVSGLFPT
jgi:hypothetical protein